jgi:hypothetical protein
VIYEHGKPWRNDDVDRVNSLLANQSSLAIITAQTSGVRQEEWEKGIRI